MREALQAVYECETRGGGGRAGRAVQPDHALQRALDEGGRQDAAQESRRGPELLRPQAHQRRARGDELDDLVSQEAGARLQEPGVLRDLDIPPAAGS